MGFGRFNWSFSVVFRCFWLVVRWFFGGFVYGLRLVVFRKGFWLGRDTFQVFFRVTKLW